MVNSLGGISNINNSSNNNSMSMGKKRVSKRHKVKPLKPRGRLIENSEMIGPKCLARDIKAIGKGIKGEANDYELGRQNDLAMAVGSYGLAGYLATKTPTTKGKIMEFVGASVFLGMMKLWPKIAFQYPLQARYGVNVCQKYEDSYGRIKDFYQDPQYTPWDLYSQEDYDMMAKKMGIPDNAKNKNQKVQEKAHDIALQANTWWMLTAGLASGIGTPLLCNQLEKPVAALAQWIDLNAAKLQLDRIKVVEVTKDYKPQNTKALKELQAVLSENKTLTSEVVDKLTKILTLVGKDEKADITCVYAMKQQIRALAPTTTFDAERVLGYFKNPQGCSNFNGLNLKDLIKKYNIDLSKINPSQIKSSDEFLEALKTAAKDKKTISGYTIDDAFRPILQELNSMFNPSTIDGDFKKNITDLFNRMDAVRTNQKHMFNFYKKNVGDVEGSIIANYANKFNDAFVKALGIKGKDLKAASQNDKAAREVVTKYLQEACKDEKKYTKVIKKLAKIQEDLLKTLDEDLLKKYADKVKDGTDVFGEGDTFSIIKRHFVGSGEQFLDGSQLKVYQSQLARRIEGIQAFFAKPIVALDIFRRIETGDLEKQWKAFQSSDTSLKNVKFEDVKKIITEMFTKNDKTSSYATKHGISTPSLYQAIYKLVYPLEVPVGETLEDIALNGKHSNKNYYKGFLSKDTIAALGEENSKILQILSDISAKINFWLGYGSDPLNPNCKPSGDYYAPKLNANIFAKDDLVSQSMERVVSDTAKRKRNTKIWSGFMIGTAVITVATTLIALLTIGKGSKKEQKKTQNSSKGVVA